MILLVEIYISCLEFTKSSNNSPADIPPPTISIFNCNLEDNIKSEFL